jgi:hypothetical protein
MTTGSTKMTTRTTRTSSRSCSNPENGPPEFPHTF